MPELDPRIPLGIVTPKFNSPFETLGQIYNLREMQQRQQLQQQQMADLAAQEQERKQKVQAAQLLSQAYTDAQDPSTGEVDRAKLTSNLTRLGVGDHIPVILKTIDDASEAKSKAELARQQAREASTKADTEELGYAKTIAQPMKDSNYDPFIIQSMLNLAKAQGHTASVAPFEQIYQQDPQKFQAYVEKLLTLPSKPPEAFKLSPGETQFNPQGQPIATVAPKPEAPTAASLDARAQELLTKQNLGQPLTPQEDAELKAYNARKTVTTDAAALAASGRAADAQEHANTIQQTNQQFQMQQAGRKELSEKVEQPYQTALASAQTLRDTVASAQGGNKIGAALQSLETTMAAIRAQGLNRINTTELGVPASAGNAWDRIQGWFGKATAGQPVPPQIQKDMTDFAGILEKSARMKYEQGFKSTTKRYGLADEQMLEAPGSGPAPAANNPVTQPSTAAPSIGEIRIINGKRAKWDGKGWLAVGD